MLEWYFYQNILYEVCRTCFGGLQQHGGGPSSTTTKKETLVSSLHGLHEGTLKSA
jgi:hypothetical protein